MQPTPEVRDDPAERRFELAIGDDTAVVEYTLDRGVMTFLHTFVPEALRGRGLATHPVEASLAQARARGLAVVPRCAVFAAYMKAHAETHDLLAADARSSIAR